MSDMSKQAQWIDEVRTRPGSMSQRKESVVSTWPGGVAALVKEARSKNVHLVRLTDDQGMALIAASVHPFEVLA